MSEHDWFIVVLGLSGFFVVAIAVVMWLQSRRACPWCGEPGNRCLCRGCE